jgi:hypothetical protein
MGIGELIIGKYYSGMNIDKYLMVWILEKGHPYGVLRSYHNLYATNMSSLRDSYNFAHRFRNGSSLRDSYGLIQRLLNEIEGNW